MREVRAWLRSSRSLTVLFVAVMCLPAVALVTLGVRLLEQDRALEAQRLAELRESAADRLVNSLKQALSASEAGLAPSEDAVRVTFSPGGIETNPPNALLYYPALPPSKEPPAGVFREAEDAEFRSGEFEKAIVLCRKLAASADPAVRAGALLRLARNLRKSGRPDDALNAYNALARIESASLEGVPADLAARRARCAVLEQAGRTAELQKEAAALLADLRTGRWRLDRGTYLLYAGKNLEPEREAIASAVDWLWEQWKETPREPGRRALCFDGIPVTVLWQATPERLVALVAGARYQEKNWFAGLRPVLDPAGMQAYLTNEGGCAAFGRTPVNGSAKVQRAAAETGLPWNVVVTSADGHAVREAFASRRHLLLAGLALVAAVILAASYAVWRAMARELAVARMQSDFVAAVSHEFRTPLTSLRHFNELLLDDDDLPAPKRRQFYEAQERATNRLHRLVEALLDFGRMEAGAREYRFEPVDVACLVERVAAEFQNEARAQGFEIRTGIAANGAFLKADPEPLSRAIWNLLDNAVKYSGDSRAIELGLERRDGWLEVSVSDHGIGIPPEEQRQVFRKFFRGAGAQARGIKGTGIGLAMVSHIVKAHGGSLRLASKPGEGSTFTILLPEGE